MVNKDAVIEIAQVANGFVVRNAPGHWFGEDRQRGTWIGESGDYLVFRTMAELQLFLAAHFSHRARPNAVDILPPVAKVEKKAA